MQKTLWILGLVFAGMLAACDDTGSATGEGGAGGGGLDAGVDAATDAATDGGACPATPHAQLLNAPTDATVVQKVPTHPPLGPEGLP